jgi:hypothetical protein
MYGQSPKYVSAASPAVTGGKIAPTPGSGVGNSPKYSPSGPVGNTSGHKQQYSPSYTPGGILNSQTTPAYNPAVPGGILTKSPAY